MLGVSSDYILLMLIQASTADQNIMEHLCVSLVFAQKNLALHSHFVTARWPHCDNHTHANAICCHRCFHCHNLVLIWCFMLNKIHMGPAQQNPNHCLYSLRPPANSKGFSAKRTVAVKPLTRHGLFFDTSCVRGTVLNV